MSQSSTSNMRSIGYAAGAVVLALVLGIAAGALIAKIAPENKFSWAGLAIAPLWFGIEIFFEGVVAVLGAHAKAVRVLSTVAVIVGFYVAWFALRVVAP